MAEPLKAAFGKVKMTPEEHAPLQGYDAAANIADPAKHVLDDIYARILLLDDGRARKVLIGIDSCLTSEVPFLPVKPVDNGGKYNYLANTFAEGTRAEWGEASEGEESSVTVIATHTHSAPAYFSRKYTTRITAAIRDLIHELQPVRLKAASGECTVSVNRRPHLQHNDSIPIDRSLQVLIFETAGGQPLGALVNCAVHPTLLMNTIGRVSGEFVGLAMNELDERYGDGFVSLFVQGFSGDVGPIDHFRTETEDTYPLVREMGHRLYEDIKRTAARLTAIDGLPLRSDEKAIRLPAKEDYYMPYVPMTIHGLRIGEVVLFSTSGEIFNGFTGPLRSGSPFPLTLLAGLANGYSGYLPTLAAFRDGLGGYEIKTTPYSEEACPIFAEGAAELIRNLHA